MAGLVGLDILLKVLVRHWMAKSKAGARSYQTPWGGPIWFHNGAPTWQEALISILLPAENFALQSYPHEIFGLASCNPNNVIWICDMWYIYNMEGSFKISPFVVLKDLAKLGEAYLCWYQNVFGLSFWKRLCQFASILLFFCSKKIFILTNQKHTRIVIEIEKMTHDLNLNLLNLNSFCTGSSSQLDIQRVLLIYSRLEDKNLNWDAITQNEYYFVPMLWELLGIIKNAVMYFFLQRC